MKYDRELRDSLEKYLSRFNDLKLFDEPTKDMLREPFLRHALRGWGVDTARERLSDIARQSLVLSLCGGFFVALYVSGIPRTYDILELIRHGLLVLAMFVASLIVATVLPYGSKQLKWRLRGPRYLIILSLGTMANGVGVAVAYSFRLQGENGVLDAYIGGAAGAIVFFIATLVLLNLVQWTLFLLIGRENLSCPQSKYVMALYDLLLVLESDSQEPIDSHRREKLVIGLERAARALSAYPRRTRGMDLSTDIAVRTQRERVVAAIRRKKMDILWPNGESFEQVRTWIIGSFQASTTGRLRELEVLEREHRKDMLKENFLTLASKSVWGLVIGVTPLALTIGYQTAARTFDWLSVIPDEIYRYAVPALVLWFVMSVVTQLDPSWRDKLDAVEGLGSLFGKR